ncbi:hypothetical protein AVEN_104807-1 [Araneus ventricosus]|uniref:Uncharacterized protein n=1 Tax=Araneus ventricosus TaxID=182803 RepID=A0A4Y2I9T2_ARAVE|nr:hypothetical protein AVEN_104807-1 [Araneus ventricosus]
MHASSASAMHASLDANPNRLGFRLVDRLAVTLLRSSRHSQSAGNVALAFEFRFLVFAAILEKARDSRGFLKISSGSLSFLFHRIMTRLPLWFSVSESK